MCSMILGISQGELTSMETATQTTSTFLSHDEYPLALEQAVQNARARIRVQGDQPDATVAQQLQVVDELLQFGLGRYLLAKTATA